MQYLKENDNIIFLKGKKCNFIFNKLVICFLQRLFSLTVCFIKILLACFDLFLFLFVHCFLFFVFSCKFISVVVYFVTLHWLTGWRGVWLHHQTLFWSLTVHQYIVYMYVCGCLCVWVCVCLYVWVSSSSQVECNSLFRGIRRKLISFYLIIYLRLFLNMWKNIWYSILFDAFVLFFFNRFRFSFILFC